MFNFSSKTEVNKEYKLSDFLKQIKASKEVKDDAKKIKKIFFKNVLNNYTLNCEEDEKYKNIYVIEILLLTDSIPRLFLEELDKNINFHTYYIFKYEDEISTWIAYKEINRKTIVDKKYYIHDFHKDTLIELPIINNVKDAYREILAYEIGRPYRASESPEEYISRIKLIAKLEFQISKTEKAIQYETQPKKKFEYNARLRDYKKEYADLLKVEE